MGNIRDTIIGLGEAFLEKRTANDSDGYLDPHVKRLSHFNTIQEPCIGKPDKATACYGMANVNSTLHCYEMSTTCVHADSGVLSHNLHRRNPSPGILSIARRHTE